MYQKLFGKYERIKLRARQLRNNQTEAEKRFWEIVRRRQIYGERFLRQFPIMFEWGNRTRFFVADFYCSKKKLIVELDGPVHGNQEDYDILRSDILTSLGYAVIRFSNEDVQDSEAIKKKLKEILEN